MTILAGMVLTAIGGLLVFIAAKKIIGRFLRREYFAIRYKLKFRPAPPAERYRLKNTNE